MKPEPTERRPKVCLVSTVPLTLTVFMSPHIRMLSETCRVTLVSSPVGASWTDGGQALEAFARQGIAFRGIPLARDVAPVDDLKALFALWRLFRAERFDVVQSITPKAGLLSMVAALAARVPVRVHWFVGQVWATKRGFSRWLFKTLDRCIAACATHLLADSASQRSFLAAEAVVRDGQVTVLADGSVCGVDTERFRPDADARSAVRRDHGIPDDAVVALYLGRLRVEKGIPEIAYAAAQAFRTCPTMHLLVVGPDEEGLRDAVRHACREWPSRMTFVEFTSQPEAFMAASDIFLLPSHREGFGATVIEAAACGVPTIGTAIYGLTDAIADGESGLLVPVRDAAALTAALVTLSTDHQLRRTLGVQARRRVERCFAETRLVAALRAYYERLLAIPVEVS